MTAEDMPLHSPSRTEVGGCTWQALLTLCTVPVLHVLSGLVLELAPRKTLHLKAGQTDPYESSCLVEGDTLHMAACCSRTNKHSNKFIAN